MTNHSNDRKSFYDFISSYAQFVFESEASVKFYVQIQVRSFILSWAPNGTSNWIVFRACDWSWAKVFNSLSKWTRVFGLRPYKLTGCFEDSRAPRIGLNHVSEVGLETFLHKFVSLNGVGYRKASC